MCPSASEELCEIFVLKKKYFEGSNVWNMTKTFRDLDVLKLGRKVFFINILHELVNFRRDSTVGIAEPQSAKSTSLPQTL